VISIARGADPSNTTANKHSKVQGNLTIKKKKKKKITEGKKVGVARRDRTKGT
jgi:hypothetical protein